MAYSITETCTGCTACTKICPVAAIRGKRNLLHTIDPALCIDCGACGRICPVDAVDDTLGQLILHTRRSQWLKPSVKVRECISCMVCLQSCPVNCLDWGEPEVESHRTFPVLHDSRLCISCEFCAQACPVDAIEMLVPVSQPASQE
jgi:formate hydrogenlyase subunit 6/NADH:ubiquinone oxidoreductase subunit I